MARTAPQPLVSVWAVVVAAAWAIDTGRHSSARAAEPGAAGDREVRVQRAGTLPFPGSAPAAVGSAASPGAAPRPGETPTLRGLSGLAWLGGDRWVAVMDNADRLVTFTLALAADGRPLAIADVALVALAARHDYEDIAVCPANLRSFVDPRRRPPAVACLLLCEEDTPAIRAIDIATGHEVGRLPLPPILSRRRPNRGLEAMALDPAAACLWTCSEEGLDGDAAAPTPTSGTVVRLLALDLGRGPERPRQYAYAVDPPHAGLRLAGGPVLSGVVALVALGEGDLLVLERSALPGVPPFENRLYRVETGAATDVADLDGPIEARPDLFLPKQRIWSAAAGCNLEGLALGPPLAGGGRALVALSDNDGLAAPAQVVGLRIEGIH